MIYYSQGDAIELTGETVVLHKAMFHKATFIEGHLQGKELVISDDNKLRQENFYNRKPQNTKR